MANILKALSEGTDAAGGFIVPEELSKEILAYIQDNAVTLPDLQRVPMGSDELRLPKLVGGSTARWIGESTTITGADITFGRTTMSAKKVAALMTASTELLEDAPQSVAAIISEQMGKDLALAIDGEILGSDTTNFADALGAVGNATNTVSAGTLSWTTLINAQHEILADKHPAPDVMYTHPNNIKTLKLLTDGNARPIFDEATFGSPLLRDGAIGTIAGMAVKPTTQLTASSMIVGVKGRFGYYAVRRNLKFNRFYQIGTDDWVFQANMRVAFAAKYKDAYCLIHSIA
ncbi:MAG: phage major capsid protein [Candidatus Schekmanbacteria bacterium]|nr:MAG: phage major capsid protein [Candidatus Schekmanbacteria bacterium]